ncbi:U3 small nucleolar ribonucleoprotein protein MPP10 [Boleophthalmus pectinirostris]|uniref:U3 small nucleolar ribonucleoprotein protein MPP10 n=1 Tax=Boleophthalmus pectinirostris TaxID=150288 RepID=UPI000A1C633A|nr:U3 small nucleolar ribonucleoprotein protein MPP10 [Boleophthalmus pectinirostris]
MASGEWKSVLEECVKKINVNTTHLENFLSLQDDVAADFTSITKTLYDLQKAHEPQHFKGSPLVQLAVKDFDEEQIWQELELQNDPVLQHFEQFVEDIVSNETLTMFEEDEDEDEEDEEELDQSVQASDDEKAEEEEDDEEEEEEEELKTRKTKKKTHDSVDEYTEEDSDLDFDVDALEKREKLKKKTDGKKSKTHGIPSEVDDKFFKLSDMESFLDDMDKREGKDNDNEDDVDYFQDLPSDEEDELNLEQMISSKKKNKINVKSSRNLKYNDYFDSVEGEMAKADVDSENGDEDQEDEEDNEDDDDEYESDEAEEEEDGKNEEQKRSKNKQKKVMFNLSGDEESEGEDMEEIFGGKSANSAKSESKSPFEKRQEKMSEKISELEKAALAEKPWQLTGEVSAQARPENSMLEEDVEFEQSSRMAPAITEETTLQLEDIIKQRIKDGAFDDVVRKEKPKEEVFEYKKRLTLDHEKSKQSLAEVYEQEYIKKIQQKKEEEENPAHVEIQKLMDTLFLKLDALSNFHFTPKPSVPEVKVVSNLPSIAMEEVAPVSVSDATLLAPEEVKEKNKAGDILGDTEKTTTDKKRERRHKKKVKRLKIQEKERRQKLKEAQQTGQNKKPSKTKVTEDLKKLTKGGKATLLKDEGKDKALRSSQAFFSELQHQVKSQIKSAKDQSSKKKKHKEVSASKLKL